MAMEVFQPLIAAVTAFGVAVGPAALADTRIVDWIRSRFDQRNRASGDWWLLASAVGGVGMALLFQLNFVGPIVVALPALAGQSPHLVGVWGQVLTGFGIAGFSGYWHEKLDANASAAQASRRAAGVEV